MSRSPAPDAAPIDAALELLACPVCGLPLGRHGLEAVAEYYNASLQWRGELPVVNGRRITLMGSWAMV